MTAALALQWSPSSSVGVGLIVLLVLAALAAAIISAHKSSWSARSITSVALRALTLVILAVVLLAPQRVIPAPDADEKPTVAILVDRSASMSIEDEQLDDAPASRLAAVCAHWLDPAFLAELRTIADARILAFDQRVVATPIDQLLAGGAQGEQTRLVRALDATLAAARPDAANPSSPARLTDLVLLSDAIDTDHNPLPSAAGSAVAAAVRVHAVSVGSAQRIADLSLYAAPESDLVYEGQSTELLLRLRETGFENQPVRVTVTRQGHTGGEPPQIIFDQSVAIAGRRELRVPVTPTIDPAARTDDRQAIDIVEYTARIEAMPGERDTTNNQRSAFVRVTGDTLKVCVFENEPYWDTRFFIEAMRDDPQVELTAVQSLGYERGRPRLQVIRYTPDATSSTQQRVAAPLDETSLFKFDVIVLGKGIDAFFPGDDAEKLERFVTQRGGALVFLRGQPAQEGGRTAQILDRIAPVIWGKRLLAGRTLAVTPEGQSNPALSFDKWGGPDDVVTELPGMIAATSVEDEKALSVVWLRQQGGGWGGGGGGGGGGGSNPDAAPAAVAHMHAGRGRTLAVMTDGLWRWGFLPATLDEYTSVYQMFWSRAIRWLVMGGDFLPGQDVALSTDRVTARPGQPVRVEVRARYADENFNPALRVITPDGAPQAIELTRDEARAGERFHATFTPGQGEGIYRVELAAPGMNPDQLATRIAVYEDRVEFDDTAARPHELAALTGATGGVMLPIDNPRALLDIVRNEINARRSRTTTEPAWDTWWVFTAIVAVLCAEWFWRRRGGLP